MWYHNINEEQPLYYNPYITGYIRLVDNSRHFSFTVVLKYHIVIVYYYCFYKNLHTSVMT